MCLTINGEVQPAEQLQCISLVRKEAVISDHQHCVGVVGVDYVQDVSVARVEIMSGTQFVILSRPATVAIFGFGDCLATSLNMRRSYIFCAAYDVNDPDSPRAVVVTRDVPTGSKQRPLVADIAGGNRTPQSCAPRPMRGDTHVSPLDRNVPLKFLMTVPIADFESFGIECNVRTQTKQAS